jgi:hypothetical protein
VRGKDNLKYIFVEVISCSRGESGGGGIIIIIIIISSSSSSSSSSDGNGGNIIAFSCVFKIYNFSYYSENRKIPINVKVDYNHVKNRTCITAHCLTSEATVRIATE